MTHHPSVDPDYQPSPTTPTDIRPGTKEKVAALAARMQRGEELWHPQDRAHFKDRFAWRLPVVKDDYDFEVEDNDT